MSCFEVVFLIHAKHEDDELDFTLGDGLYPVLLPLADRVKSKVRENVGLEEKHDSLQAKF